MVTWSSFGNQREACNTANTVRGLALALRVLVSDWLGQSNSRRYKNISRFLPQPPKRIVCRRDYICVVRSRPLTGTTVDCGEKPKCAIYDSSAVDVSSWWWGWGTPMWACVLWGFEACCCRTAGKFKLHSNETSLTSHRAQVWNAEMRKPAKTNLRPHRNTISRRVISGKWISFADS